MKKVIIFGNTDIARLAEFYFRTDTDREVAAFCVDDEYVKGSEFCGLPVVPFSRIAEYPPTGFDVFVAIGYGKLNGVRRSVFERLEALGYDFASYISSRATVLSDRIGRNCFIMEDNTVQPFTSIGDDVILWSGNHIGHDARIGSHCFLTSHVVVSGYVKVGEQCFIGVNSSLRNEVEIGARSIIGAGSLIMKSLPEESVCIVKGTEPTKITSSRFFKMGLHL